MKILAADTSTNIVSVALLDAKKIKASVHKPYSRSLGSALIPIIDKLLNKAGCDIKKIDLFCIGIGPGSFTGLRASLATFRALSITLKKPLIGISSFDVIARNLNQASDICVMTDARQGKVYARFYSKKSGSIIPVSGFMLDKIENIITKIKKPTIISGNAVAIYKNEMLQHKNKISIAEEEKLWHPDAKFLAKLALKKHAKAAAEDPFELLPLYIYPKECQIKKVNN
ncbi:MAG: tRNA (adenosine(37)-N6)-threonylcarbamoyltransferase complex dimerization subunit type 1 TsaB [Candidatus Omnitrophica bacterium]|nr:tRNA (adenosine(37)-N6)-threonylcarbamoyltransferase complex dimerization subunit type 1 TsaB [Candidatus Omnitrophota bacterium]